MTKQAGSRHEEKVILDSQGIQRVLNRIAHEIIEQNKGTENLALVGIRTGGVYIAHRLAEKIYEIEKVQVPVGELDVTLYRDDLMGRKTPPTLKKTELPSTVTAKRIVLVDDVLFTGRTIRAALDGLIDFGRPELVRLAALIDRGHRELPIRADYVGKNIPTSRSDKVRVLLDEEGFEDRVVILRDGNA